MLEVANGGDKGRRCDGADALQLGGALHRFVVFVVRADPFVAPLDVFVELGREAASQIAAASLASFLPDLHCIRYGATS